LFEMAGHPRFQEKGFQFYLALNAMKGWIERQRRMRGGIGGTTPGFEETYRRDSRSTWQADWQAKRQEAPQKAKASPDTYHRSQATTEKIVRQIYEAGEGANQAQLARQWGISDRGAGMRAAKAIEAGMVENVGYAKGRRGKALRLTAKGRAIIGAPELAA